MKKLLGIVVLGLLLSVNVYADTTWLKFPLEGNETMNFNLKTTKEYGPNQYSVESVLTKDSKKIKYQKKSIETLVKYCAKEPGLYSTPKELLSRGEITSEVYKTSSGINPGEIKVYDYGLVTFEMPYVDIKGSLNIFCWTDRDVGKIGNKYTKEKEKRIIGDNLQRLYDEKINIEYIDCRRKMTGHEIGGNVKWFPLKEGTNGYYWNEELCRILDT